ncbi:hypothetical protein FIV00_06450 [Labrenzia sp. THAF82]|uniref:hypothetical protein n=1 Tax=Labrenzia sp. THAF82 TaxID=2587861 RepID=UPI001267C88D|nr:hypothetical protein [Labrenzia sp. THAF82]QFT30103.1 hypothetical protein FIV00_06450 [Labrenzia sp. THAF82]
MNQIVQQSNFDDATFVQTEIPHRRPFEITKDCIQKMELTRNDETGIWEREGEPILEVSTERFLDLVRISTEKGVHHFWQDHQHELFAHRDPATLNASDAAALFEAVRYDVCKVHIIDKFHGGKI